MRPKRLKSNPNSDSTKDTSLSKQEKSRKTNKASEGGKVKRTYRNNKSDKSRVKRESLKRVLKADSVKSEPEVQDKTIAIIKNENNEDETIQNERKVSEPNQRLQCRGCNRYFRSYAGLRRHEVSCSLASNGKGKSKGDGATKKDGKTSRSLTDRPEESKTVNCQENLCNEKLSINDSTLRVVGKKLDGSKGYEIVVASNHTPNSSSSHSSTTQTNEVEVASKSKQVTYPTTDLLNVNCLSDGQQSDNSEVADIVIKNENKNDENNVVRPQCMHCNKVYKTYTGVRRHESSCKKKLASITDRPINDGNESDAAASSEPALNCPEPLAENGNDVLNIENENKCNCCGEDKETAHIIGDFECKDCLKLFRLKSSLERHIRVVHNGESHECPQCGAKCPDKGTLARHMYTHTGLKPYSCPVCKQEFSRKYHLVRHNMQTGCDGKEKPIFPCQVCGREFNRKDNLREHLRAHAGQTKRKKKFTCECCGVVYEATELLKLHKKTHNGEKQYACDFCPKKFNSSGAMKKHRRTHTGEKPYECVTCHRRFAAKETLNRHVRLHTGYKPHCCQYCGKRFIQSTQLKSHLSYHTGQSVMQAMEAFVCDLCGKKFNRKARLNEHVKFIHLGAKPYECEQCGKTFIRKEDLSRHRIIHSGIKAHQCPICSKAFTMKSSLKVHLLTHTKEPPSSCDECGRAFIRQDCLLRHMKNKHKEMLEEIKSEAEKKKLQQQLLQVAAEASLVEGMEEREELDENGLVDAVRELLTLLVDETTLRGLGWPGAGVEALLEAVIRRCGHEPAPSSTPRHDRLRHNIKLLFTVVIDDSAVKALLNNQTVDEVILHVLRLAKS